jgi:hypothetical protein
VAIAIKISSLVVQGICLKVVQGTPPPSRPAIGISQPPPSAWPTLASPTVLNPDTGSAVTLHRATGSAAWLRPLKPLCAPAPIRREPSLRHWLNASRVGHGRPKNGECPPPINYYGYEAALGDSDTDLHPNGPILLALRAFILVALSTRCLAVSAGRRSGLTIFATWLNISTGKTNVFSSSPSC